jgi:2-iminobutanoate/2-iminopropanoate deaminase
MEVLMGKKQAFMTDKAAVTGGPYSQAIIYNDLIYVSGQGAVDPETNQIKLGTVEEEAEMALQNIRINLLDIEDYGRFNEVYKRYFKEDRPARVCIQAGKLPFNTRVEIDAIAHT